MRHAKMVTRALQDYTIGDRVYFTNRLRTIGYSEGKICTIGNWTSVTGDPVPYVRTWDGSYFTDPELLVHVDDVTRDGWGAIMLPLNGWFAPVPTCRVSTGDGCVEDPLTYFCGHPAGHAGTHGMWSL